jgi:hypothetical protein
VDGHCTFSGSVVVVVVEVESSVDNNEVPPRRGIVSVGIRSITNMRSSMTGTAIWAKDNLRKVASVILLKTKTLRLPIVARLWLKMSMTSRVITLQQIRVESIYGSMPLHNVFGIMHLSGHK